MLWGFNEDSDEFSNGAALKNEVKKAFDEVLSENGWDDCDDSTSALTTKQMSLKKVIRHRSLLMFVLLNKIDMDYIALYIRKQDLLPWISGIGIRFLIRKT